MVRHERIWPFPEGALCGHVTMATETSSGLEAEQRLRKRQMERGAERGHSGLGSL